jgi:Protein of unknown function (DUF2815)
MSIQLTTPYAVLSFPHLFVARPRAEAGEPVFSCALIFGPEQQKSAEYKKMQAAVMDAAKEKFGVQVNMKSLILPFRDAGEKQYAGYNDGDTYITPWCDKNHPPGIVDRQKQKIEVPSDVWAGQTVRASVSPFAWVKSGKKGVSFGLNHVQVIKTDTPRIDGRISADKAFDAIEDDEDDTPF